MLNKNLFLYQSLANMVKVALPLKGGISVVRKRENLRVPRFLYPLRGGPKAGLGGP